ncbi:hypothetical protein imdm_511 [gamma proteobacterium IMCC2047]|nr:hypothetical protein imdm_511 [gamma proteobacterium IMCC2047]
MDKNCQKGSFLTGFLFNISEHLKFFRKTGFKHTERAVH